MDDLRFGTAVRQVRIRRDLRQLDLARTAGISRATVSRIERGHLGSLSVDTVRRVAAALDIRVDLIARWRSGDLDRLLNSHYSRFHELVARRFASLPGWIARPEVSFAHYADRGVIDILAFHSESGMVLVIELKTDIADVNEMVGTLDRKRRNAVAVAREQGWPVDEATRVSAWLIVADGATNRRRVAAHRVMLRSAFPMDGRSIGGWLIRPDRPIRALSIWSYDHQGNASTELASVRQVRRPARSGNRVVPRSRASSTRGVTRSESGLRSEDERMRGSRKTRQAPGF